MIIKYYIIIIICNFFTVFQHLDIQKPSYEGFIKFLNFVSLALYQRLHSISDHNIPLDRIISKPLAKFIILSVLF